MPCLGESAYELASPICRRISLPPRPARGIITHQRKASDIMIPCTVYIDEAGDLGVARGTRWFVLTAVIVNKSDEPLIRAKIRSIRATLNIPNIHFRNVRNFDKRCYIVKELSDVNFQYVNILFDTDQFVRAKMPTERIAYNYICRFLLERVSWLLRDTGREGKIILSSRKTDKDAELLSYIRDRLIPYTDNQVASVFTGFDSKPASTWDMLQLADVCATSMFCSHEINRYGFTTPCFVMRLLPKLYRHNEKLISYGIKYFDKAMMPPNGYLQSRKICGITKQELPGATAT